MNPTYIIAVSGGIDSVVLLHKLMSVKPPRIKYIVAHFDHGIRSDSSQDAEFVGSLAKRYDALFISERVELGEDASEDEARDKRYAFLRSIKNKFKAEAIITGHHQDDVIETMIVNMLRGTGPQGLIGYTSSDIIRPFMDKTKEDLRQYAKEHGLEWREDSTNVDERYMRNYVRSNLMPKVKTADRKRLLDIRTAMQERYLEINNLAKGLLVQTMKNGEIHRPFFVVLPYVIQKEIMAMALRQADVELDRRLVERAVIAAKTLGIDKHIELKKNVKLYSKKDTVLLEIISHGV